MITIRHTRTEGTVLEGSVKGDGVYEIVKRHGFTWRPTPGIHIRGSRDRRADTDRITNAAEALRAAPESRPAHASTAGPPLGAQAPQDGRAPSDAALRPEPPVDEPDGALQ